MEKCRIVGYHSPEESSAEVSRIVISPEHASKLGIEDVLHLHTIMRVEVEEKEGKKGSMSFAAGACLWRMSFSLSFYRISSRSFAHFTRASSDSGVS